MKKTIKKGRPELPSKKQKRLHYSVWLNEDQKRLIDERIARSNLSASQYILTQLELSPVRPPARKDIPDHIARLIINLEKLSGMLAFYAHRTADAQLISSEWINSSQLVRRLSELVSNWLFEQFGIPALVSFFESNEKSLARLSELIATGAPSEENTYYLNQLGALRKENQQIRRQYQRYYTSQDHDLSIFQQEKVTYQQDIHAEIKKHIKTILDLV